MTRSGSNVMMPDGTRDDSPPTAPHILQPLTPTSRCRTSPERNHARRSRCFLVSYIWYFIIRLYRNVVLLALYRLYLRRLPRGSATATPNNGFTSQTPSMQRQAEDDRLWESLVRSLRRHYSFVSLFSAVAFYHALNSIKSSNAGQHPWTRTTGIISLIVSANGVVLAVFFSLWISLFDGPECITSSPPPKDPPPYHIDKRTHVAMFIVVPQACMVWVLICILLYLGCSFELPASATYPPAQAVAEVPWWSTFLICMALVSSTVHFFILLLWFRWLDKYASGGHDQRRSSLPMHSMESQNTTRPSYHRFLLVLGLTDDNARDDVRDDSSTHVPPRPNTFSSPPLPFPQREAPSSLNDPQPPSVLGMPEPSLGPSTTYPPSQSQAGPRSRNRRKRGRGARKSETQPVPTSRQDESRDMQSPVVVRSPSSHSRTL